MKKLILISLLVTLAACSSKKKEIIFDTALGEETRQLAKSLPSNLQGDSENARYTDSIKRGLGMTSSDGSE